MFYFLVMLLTSALSEPADSGPVQMLRICYNVVYQCLSQYCGATPRYYRSAPPPSSGSDTDRYDTVFNKNHRSKSCSDITAIILYGLPFSVGVNSNQRPGSSYSPPAARPVHTTRKSDFNLIEFYTQKGQIKSKSSFLLQ